MTLDAAVRGIGEHVTGDDIERSIVGRSENRGSLDAEPRRFLIGLLIGRELFLACLFSAAFLAAAALAALSLASFLISTLGCGAGGASAIVANSLSMPVRLPSPASAGAGAGAAASLSVRDGRLPSPFASAGASLVAVGGALLADGGEKDGDADAVLVDGRLKAGAGAADCLAAGGLGGGPPIASCGG